MDTVLSVVIVAVSLALVVLALLTIMARLFRKVGPNEALIIYGLGGTRIVTGGGAVVVPMIQTWNELSLELMSFDVAPTQDLYTRQGVAVTVEAVAQIKVKSDTVSIRTAAEQFLTKTPAEREGLIRLVMEGHLRGITGQLTVEQIVKEPEMVAERMRANVADDMNKMGLEVVSFTIKEVKDKNDYIANMGRPDVARVKRDADIATAEAERDTAIRQADTMREAAIARADADQQRVIAEMASRTRQAEAERDLALKSADFDRATKTVQAQADKAYDIQANVMQQQVIAEQVRIERVQREEQIKVQEMEIVRRERELEATVLKPAEAERRRIETLAAAEQQRKEIEAKGQASADRLDGGAQAEVIRLQGQAEAEIIRARGEAEAAAMTVRAAAFNEYNQAALLDKMLSGLPEIARAMAEPLSKVDRITIVSTGGDAGSSLGASQITTDLTKMIAQAPALFETLTGLKVSELMARLPGIGEPSTNGGNGAHRPGAVGTELAKDSSERR